MLAEIFSTQDNSPVPIQTPIPSLGRLSHRLHAESFPRRTNRNLWHALVGVRRLSDGRLPRFFKLTLNLGLRYDVYTPMVEEHNRLANFDFQTGLFVAPGVTPGTSRSGDVATNWKNFSPRVGFAYTLGADNKTAVRGGYGIFYDMQADQNDTELAYNDLPGVYGSQSSTASLGTYPLTPVMYLSQGPSPIIFSSITNPTGRASAAYFHNPTTYIEEWNLNIERQLMKDMVLQIGYEGTRGVHLTYLRNLNQATQPLDSNFSDSSGNEGRPYESTVPNIAAIRTEGHDISLIITLASAF